MHIYNATKKSKFSDVVEFGIFQGQWKALMMHIFPKLDIRLLRKVYLSKRHYFPLYQNGEVLIIWSTLTMNAARRLQNTKEIK